MRPLTLLHAGQRAENESNDPGEGQRYDYFHYDPRLTDRGAHSLECARRCIKPLTYCAPMQDEPRNGVVPNR